jgi:hypothetical protein
MTYLSRTATSRSARPRRAGARPPAPRRPPELLGVRSGTFRQKPGDPEMPDARTQRAPENHPEPEAHAGTRQSRVSHTAHGADRTGNREHAGRRPGPGRTAPAALLGGGGGGRARAERGCAAAGGRLRPWAVLPFSSLEHALSAPVVQKARHPRRARLRYLVPWFLNKLYGGSLW